MSDEREAMTDLGPGDTEQSNCTGDIISQGTVVPCI